MSRMHNPAHPGEVVREYLPEDMTVSDAARRLGVSRQTLSALLNKRAAGRFRENGAGISFSPHSPGLC